MGISLLFKSKETEWVCAPGAIVRWGYSIGKYSGKKDGEGNNGRARVIAAPFLAYCLDYPPHCTLFILCESTYAPSKRLLGRGRSSNPLFLC